ITRPLANSLADRFEFLLVYRILADELLDFNDRRIRPLLGDRVSDILQDMLGNRQDETIQAIDALRLQYPEYADALENQFLRKAGARLEETAYDEAKGQMLIGTELHLDLLKDLERVRKASYERPKLDLGLKTRDLVSAHPLFTDLPRKQQKAIRRTMRPQFATPRETLIRKGDRGDAAYFIASGAVEVRTPTHNVRLGRGDVFGEIALMTGGRRSADVVALGYCQLLSLRAQDFKDLMERHPNLRDHVVELAEKRQLMNTDKAEHEIEDPVVPQFTEEEISEEQPDVSEQPTSDDGDDDGAGTDTVNAKTKETVSVELEVTEEIRVTEKTNVEETTATDGDTNEAPGTPDATESEKGTTSA
ncbi:cyclic nucleotide-binding domain-containing protein, partial [Roseibium sp.]|uniref:cyclic nucleotide-binding domain-containing protein n=1 Tax=Roseibium sp. TaxID=1936156 RepID=UPI002635A30A